MRNLITIALLLFCSENQCFAQADVGDSKTEERATAVFFRNHCVKCHGSQEQNSGVRLDRLNPQIVDHASLAAWQDVLDALNTGAMPPKDEKQPENDELTRVIGQITEKITDARKRLAATGGIIKMRHLTKREYLGSMKDLFGIVLPSEILPNDVSADFDTNGADQFFSLKQYENFYKAGREVVEKSLLAYTSPLPSPTTLRHDPEIRPFEEAKAKYEQMAKVMELIDAGAPIAEISKVDPKVADAGQVKLFVKRFDTRSKKPREVYESTKGRKGVPGSFAYTVKAMPHSLYKLTIVAREIGGGDVGISVNGDSVGSVQFSDPLTPSSELSFTTGIFESEVTIRVEGHKRADYDYLELTGPFDIKNNKLSFFESVISPVARKQAASDQEVASMLKQFADRAFRYQGVSDEYIVELVKVYKLERSTGKDMATALVEPLTAITTSPAFLYIKEKNNGSRGLLSQHEYAIRASYFLCGAPPDQELYDLAMSGKLYDRAVMQAQFDRMLASDNADVFLTEFINQWSDLDRFDEIDLPVKLIRDGFNDSARRELGELFKVLVRENLPIENLIDSDFVVVDQRLAKYYGLKFEGEGFGKVALPASSPRGGMLSQAAFLIMGTSGGRTSPTIRGTLIRDSFLHDPPPPPPPNIPAIENEKGQRLTVKQLVDRHKDVAQCASCHDKIDPIGYGLEKFDFLGNWRESEQIGKAPKKQKKNAKNSNKAESGPTEVAINSSGYVGSNKFEDFDGLKQVLKQNRDQLARSVYESLLAYGIGREIEFVDEKDVGENLSELKKRNYPLKEMIFEVITSKPFVTK